MESKVGYTLVLEHTSYMQKWMILVSKLQVKTSLMYSTMNALRRGLWSWTTVGYLKKTKNRQELQDSSSGKKKKKSECLLH